MASIEKYGMYLILWIGLMNLAAANTLMAECKKISFCQFEQWCVNTKLIMDFCEGEHCTKALADDKSCNLVLPFDASGMSELQQMHACNYYSPYGISKVDKISTSNSLVCKYEISHWCPDPNSKQIEHGCYRLSEKAFNSSYYLTEIPRSCYFTDQPDYSVVQSSDSKYRMWASTLFPSLEALWINNRTSMPPAALSTRFDGMNNREIGDIFEPAGEVELKTLCVKNAVPIPKRDRYDSMTNLDEYFVTDNVYQAEFDSNSKLTKYHDICENLFPNSIAASPNDYARIKNEDDIKPQVFHVAGQLEKLKPLVTCDRSRTGDEPNNPINIRKRFKTLSKYVNDDNGDIDIQLTGIDAKVYAKRSKYPSNSCADKPRTTLAIHKTAGKLNGVVDEPSFARHPLLCIRGDSPVQGTEFNTDNERVPTPPPPPAAPRIAPRSPPSNSGSSSSSSGSSSGGSSSSGGGGSSAGGGGSSGPGPSRSGSSGGSGGGGGSSSGGGSSYGSSGGGGGYGGGWGSSQFTCRPGWAMSRRPDSTRPYCFKIFDARPNDKSYNDAKEFCSLHDAKVATQEYEQDKDAMRSSLPYGAASRETFSLFLAARSPCGSVPRTKCVPAPEGKDFLWETMNGTEVPMRERPQTLYLWNNGDPNQFEHVNAANPDCSGVEGGCVMYHSGGYTNHWVDALFYCFVDKLLTEMPPAVRQSGPQRI